MFELTPKQYGFLMTGGFFAALGGFALASPTVSPLATARTIDGTIVSARCGLEPWRVRDFLSSDDMRLELEVKSKAGVTQTYQFKSRRHCFNMVESSAKIDKAKEEFPKGAAISLRVRTFKDPNACDTRNGKTDAWTTFTHLGECTFSQRVVPTQSATMLSVSVNGRQVF